MNWVIMGLSRQGCIILWVCSGMGLIYLVYRLGSVFRIGFKILFSKDEWLRCPCQR